MCLGGNESHSTRITKDFPPLPLDNITSVLKRKLGKVSQPSKLGECIEAFDVEDVQSDICFSFAREHGRFVDIRFLELPDEKVIPWPFGKRENDNSPDWNRVPILGRLEADGEVGTGVDPAFEAREGERCWVNVLVRGVDLLEDLFADPCPLDPRGFGGHFAEFAVASSRGGGQEVRSGREGECRK